MDAFQSSTSSITLKKAASKELSLQWLYASCVQELPRFRTLLSEMGFFLSALYIIFGAVISYFWGMLLISWAETIGRDKYEDFARYWYGRKMEVFTGITNLITLLGFVVTFIVYLKTLIPSVLETILGKKNTPMLLGEGQWGGELFWATVYSLFLLFPMSIPRKINTFRFASLFGVACTVYLTIWFVFIFFWDRNIVPSVKQNLKNASYFNFTFGGLLHALPYVNFNYMYQTNIPIIYRELHHKSYLSMQKIIISASIICIVIYITICSFGYLTLVGNPSGLYVLDSSNDILEVEFDSIPLDIGVISVLLTVIIVSPLWILPAKDTIEDLFFFEEGMSSTNNVIVSFALCILAYLFAVSFPEVGDAITVCGFTTYPLIGFILPCVFYLNIVKEKPITKEIICWIVIVFISVISGVTCYLFAYEKFTGENLIYKQS